MQLLSDVIHNYWKSGAVSPVVKDYVKQNLNPAFGQRAYQQEAITRFDFYLNTYALRPANKPIHLLLNMATGSGKTMVMAANMLELYQFGYRNFIFIVNSTNIINKTIANFTGKGDSKYVFADKIFFDFNEVHVHPVENFETASATDINILFTTIHGLHSRLKEPQENAVAFESLQQTRLVILSDEAHHLNTLTQQKRNKTAADEESSWEWTINTVIQNHPDNVLLEYTATVNLNHPEVARKYADKILMRYSLKEFRNDGYSKEIRLVKSGLNTNERILQALLLSQYRLKVANDNNIQSPYLPFKPVVLFKSASIELGTLCFENFKQLLENLHPDDLYSLRDKVGLILNNAFSYFKEKNISIEALAEELKDAFRKERCIIVNSENDSNEKQIELNRLESADNEYRAIFTVKMLTEGWDVLNLFDIVRLDEGSGTSTAGKPATSTISEAQLIGRGARYFPFLTKPGEKMYERKYDSELHHPMRCLEELYYHSINNNTYIEAITKELVAQGIYNPDQDEAAGEREVQNSQSNFPEQELKSIREQVPESGKGATLIERLHQKIKPCTYHLSKIETNEDILPDTGVEKERREVNPNLNQQISEQITLISLSLPVCLKATECIPFYHFNHLRRLFPELTSIREFLTDEKWVANTPVSIIGGQQHLQSLQPKEKLKIAAMVLSDIRNTINSLAV